MGSFPELPFHSTPHYKFQKNYTIQHEDEWVMANGRNGETGERGADVILSREQSRELFLRAKEGDRDAVIILEKAYKVPLRGYIKSRIACSKVFRQADAERFATGAFRRAIHRFQQGWRDSDYIFLKKNADSLIQSDLAVMAMKGDRVALLELRNWLDRPLTSFICSKCSDLDYSAAQGVAAEVWDRFMNAERLGLSVYNPDGRQSFFDYLKNKAKTLAGHMYLTGAGDSSRRGEEGPGIQRLPGGYCEQWRVGVYREMVNLIFLCGAKPHMLLVTAFVLFLEWKPAEIVDELGDLSLGRLIKRFCEEYYYLVGVLYFDFDTIDECQTSLCGNLMRDIYEKDMQQVYPAGAYPMLDRKSYRLVKDIPLKEFFGSKPAASVYDWNYKVKARVRDMIQSVCQ